MGKLAYPIVGGPLDGKHAITDDFSQYYQKYESDVWPKDMGAGIYKHLADEYVEYNIAGGARSKKVGSFPPSMVYIHKSLLKPLISPKDR